MTSALVYALGLGFIGTADRFDTFLLGIALCGIGQGVYLAVDLALVTDVLPNKEQDAAKDSGILNLASALPRLLSFSETAKKYWKREPPKASSHAG